MLIFLLLDTPHLVDLGIWQFCIISPPPQEVGRVSRIWKEFFTFLFVSISTSFPLPRFYCILICLSVLISFAQNFVFLLLLHHSVTFILLMRLSTVFYLCLHPFQLSLFYVYIFAFSSSLSQFSCLWSKISYRLFFSISISTPLYIFELYFLFSFCYFIRSSHYPQLHQYRWSWPISLEENISLDRSSWQIGSTNKRTNKNKERIWT